MKLREFWLYKDVENELSVCDYDPKDPGPFETFIHVREVSPELEEAVADCEKALEFYAEVSKYKEVSEPMKSLGWTPAQIAQEALAALEKAREE